MMQIVLAQLENPAFQLLLVAVFVAGIVRGFSGFGTGMIVGPIGSALFTPKLALVILLVMDTFPTIPLVLPALKKVVWREVLPMAVGVMLVMPLGIVLLKYGDVIVLRWFFSLVIFTAVAILWSGWHYRGPRTYRISALVGGMSGFLGGVSGLSGPPPIIYWMAARTGAGLVRANLIILFSISEVISIAGYYIASIITWEGVLKGLIASPIYFVGLMIGAKLFGKASETVYRRVAFTLILMAAIISMPLFD